MWGGLCLPKQRPGGTTARKETPTGNLPSGKNGIDCPGSHWDPEGSTITFCWSIRPRPTARDRGCKEFVATRPASGARRCPAPCHRAGTAATLHGGSAENPVLKDNVLPSMKINTLDVSKYFGAVFCNVYNTAFLCDCQREL